MEEVDLKERVLQQVSKMCVCVKVDEPEISLGVFMCVVSRRSFRVGKRHAASLPTNPTFVRCCFKVTNSPNIM